MQKVLQFLIYRINFIIFLLLETVAIVLIFANNPYQSASYFNSSNSVVASISQYSNSIKEYLNLNEVNASLAAENAHLKTLLIENSLVVDSSFKLVGDTNYLNKYNLINAKVINNSVDKFNNYFTINKGLVDSIVPGMGVICHSGVVGKVKSCSRNFATITSLLHKSMLISSKIKSSNAIGTTHWEGLEPTEAKLMYVPRHIKIAVGDTIVSSEFNSVFPEGEMIGTISKIKIKGDENFYNITIKLSTDFNTLSYVYVIKNKLKVEQDSLESLIKNANESK